MSRTNITAEEGTVLNLDFRSLSSSVVGGTAMMLQSTHEIDVPIAATFADDTSLTEIVFRLACNDGTGAADERWDPVISTRQNGDTQAEHTILPDDEVKTDRLQTVNHRNARYTRVEAYKAGGDAKSGDSAVASANWR